jgi:hypothetical protein
VVTGIQPTKGIIMLELHVEDCKGDDIPNLARFAHYIGVVSQINGSLIENVTITGRSGSGPEMTSADGKVLRLGAAALPPMASAKPSAIAAWCGAALHGFAHSRYSPRSDEPLRATLQKRKLHRTWNMIEDARIERLLLREFPGWQPHMMAACNHILLSSRKATVGTHRPDLESVYPLIVGRTYLPAALRQESYEAFAAEHSEYIADAVKALVMQYLTVVDPGSEDHDLTVDIVTRLHALLGDFGSDCGSHEVDPDAERQWSDPGDPEEDDEGDEDGNHEVTADPDAEGDDESESDEGEGESDEDGDPCDDGESGDGDSDGDDESDEEDDGDGTGEGGEGDADGDDGDTGDGDASDGDGDGGDDEASGRDDAPDDHDHDDDDDDEVGEERESGNGVGGTGQSDASRLAEWTSAIDSALAQDERLINVAEAVTTGPMPLIHLKQREVNMQSVPFEVQQAEYDIARELRVLMDGARPGMRRRIDRGRFNVARVVREGGATRPEEMFDRHDPGALRSTGCAVAVLADVSGSMTNEQLSGAMASVWAIDRAVQSVRGAFQGYTFGMDSEQLPPSKGDGMWVPIGKDGNTNPIAGLAAAQAWLSQQREPNRLCVVATDGAWDGHVACVETLTSMVHSGVTVAVFGIDCDVSGRFPERTGIATFKVEHAGQIGPAVGEMLVNRVRKSVHR